MLATTSGEEKARFASEAGAELVVDYTLEDVAQAVRRHTAKRGVDVVVDTVGEATWLTSLRAVARGGRIVTCGATSGPNPKEELRLVFWKHISILGSTMANDREFRALLQTVAQVAGAVAGTVHAARPLIAERIGDEGPVRALPRANIARRDAQPATHCSSRARCRPRLGVARPGVPAEPRA